MILATTSAFIKKVSANRSKINQLFDETNN